MLKADAHEARFDALRYFVRAHSSRAAPQNVGGTSLATRASSVEDLRDLIDVVSVSNDAENIQFTRFTSRTKLDKILSFHGRTGRFSEIMKGRCDSDEVVNASAVASPLR